MPSFFSWSTTEERLERRISGYVCSWRSFWNDCSVYRRKHLPGLVRPARPAASGEGAGCQHRGRGMLLFANGDPPHDLLRGQPRKVGPWSCGPVLPARWCAEALLIGETSSDSTRILGLYTFCLENPGSMTYTMPSMVREVSAMLVETMILRPGGLPGLLSGACSSGEAKYLPSEAGREYKAGHAVSGVGPPPLRETRRKEARLLEDPLLHLRRQGRVEWQDLDGPGLGPEPLDLVLDLATCLLDLLLSRQEHEHVPSRLAQVDLDHGSNRGLQIVPLGLLRLQGGVSAGPRGGLGPHPTLRHSGTCPPTEPSSALPVCRRSRRGASDRALGAAAHPGSSPGTFLPQAWPT